MWLEAKAQVALTEWTRPDSIPFQPVTPPGGRRREPAHPGEARGQRIAAPAITAHPARPPCPIEQSWNRIDGPAGGLAGSSLPAAGLAHDPSGSAGCSESIILRSRFAVTGSALWREIDSARPAESVTTTPLL